MEDALNLAILRSCFDARSRWEKAALLVWGAVLLFVSVRVFVAPTSKTVYPIFSASGRFWWTGTELYEPFRPTDVQDGYRYSPTFAILVTPFALLPDSIGGALWRLFNAAALIGAFGWLARTCFPGRLSTTHYAWLLLLLVPLALQSINNGQANLIVIAAMLGTVAAVREERWNLACAMMAVAFFIKLYPVALGMVLIVLYPRQLSWRIPLACTISLAAPFALQDPRYVLNQYEHWIALLRAEDRSDIALEHMYRDLWLLIHLYGIPIGRTAYTLIQVAAGAGIAIVCWHRQRSGWPTGPLLTSTLALVTAWMMLLGPATESSSFVLLAPSLAWSVVAAQDTPGWRDRRLLLWGSCACFLVAVLVGGFTSTVRIHGAGVHSWASLLYFVYLWTEPAPRSAVVVESEQRLAA
jgi:hypothetical protein